MDQLTILGIVVLLIALSAALIVWSAKRQIEENRFHALLGISDQELRAKAITLFVNQYPRFLKRLGSVKS